MSKRKPNGRQEIAGPISAKNPGRLLKKRAARPRSSKISAPPHLRPETADWWGSVAVAYGLRPHQLRILTLAAEAWDRGVQARETLAQTGTTYVDRFMQPRARPEVAIERDSRISFARLVRELALDVAAPGETGRPPRTAPTAGRTDTPFLDANDRRLLGMD